MMFRGISYARWVLLLMYIPLALVVSYVMSHIFIFLVIYRFVLSNGIGYLITGPGYIPFYRIGSFKFMTESWFLMLLVFIPTTILHE
jgi:hypothetical protein